MLQNLHASGSQQVIQVCACVLTGAATVVGDGTRTNLRVSQINIPVAFPKRRTSVRADNPHFYYGAASNLSLFFPLTRFLENVVNDFVDE